MISELLEPVLKFLHCETPRQWIDEAILPENLSILLIDHCHCEKKAASTAMSLIGKYTERTELLLKMSKLAREELRHFEQVLGIMKKRAVVFTPLTASRYAKGLLQHIGHSEPDLLVNKLIVGAYIEARSCERFAKLAPYLDEDMYKFYLSLLKSESRHFADYLQLAQQYSSRDIQPRVQFFGLEEAKLINSPDPQFRFHSGVPPL